MTEEEKIMEEEMSNINTTLLPQDILMDILSRFPVETLLNSFKLVCKAWCTLIQDPDFIKMHLSRGGGGGGGEGIYSNNSLICISGNELFQLYPPFSFEGIPPTKSPKRLDFDWDISSSWRSGLIGSCNGILCIKASPYSETIILLNPCTRKYKVLPKESIDECPTQFKYHKPIAYGFGCCHTFTTTTIDDEYKVVRIACRYPPGYTYYDVSKDPTFRLRIEVYSMSSNSWRNRKGIKDIPYLMSVQRPGIFLSGALHWQGNRSSHGYGNLSDLVFILISFDIRDEEFGYIEMPPCDDTREDTILMNMRGWLGIVYISPTKDVDLEIWVMKEYGIKESWTKACVIRSSNVYPHREVSAFKDSFKAGVCFLKGDQILINQGYGTLALYDMNTKKIDWDFKMVDVSGKASVDIVDYIETLVSLKSSLVL